MKNFGQLAKGNPKIMVSGGAMIFLWKYAVRPLGGAWNIYELLPAFIVSCLFIVAVSLATKAPSKEIEAEFDAVKAMVCELAAYGLLSGLFTRYIKIGNRMVSLYIALIAAMVAGRIVYGVLNALIFMAGHYAFSVFITAAFVTALPGIIIQLILIPSLVRLLEKAHLGLV